MRVFDHDLETVLAWDMESRLLKPDHIGFSIYKRCCGMSMATTWDLGSDWRFYSDSDEFPYDPVGLSQALQAADLTISYNGTDFDHYVLRSMVPEHTMSRELDLYQHVVRPTIRGTTWPNGSWGLDAVGKRVIGLGKTATPSAPALARANRFGELVSYNARDVAVTGKLFLALLANPVLIDPDGGEWNCEEVLINAIERAVNRASPVDA